MATKDVKRKRKCLSLDKKHDIIEAVDKKQATLAEICRRFDIPQGSIHTILKDREKIMAAYANGKFTPERKKMRQPDVDAVDQALLLWFKEARRQLVPISGPILIEKALDFAAQLGVNNFTASVGWLGRFKSRHGIQMKAICGESATVSCETTDDWKNTELKALLEEYSPADIFNADETGLFYKCLPTRTLAQKGETTSGIKAPKDRLTLLVAANMTGTEKLPLLTIGRFEKPRCFKNIRTLPTPYKWNTKAWMTSSIFEEWVRQLDRKYLVQGRSIALIIDNCPAHPVIPDLRVIKLVFLPPNTTSVLQPCDQGIIQSLKVHYRRRVLKRVIARIDSGGDPKSHLSMSILDAMVTASAAWNDVTQETVANCFRHAGFKMPGQTSIGDASYPDNENDRQEVGQLLEQLSNHKIEGVPSADDLFEIDRTNVETSASLTEADIVTYVQQEQETPQPEEEDESVSVAPVSSRQCLEALSTVQAYLLQQAGSSKHSQQLEDIRSFVEDTAIKKQRQTSIKDFFKK